MEFETWYILIFQDRLYRTLTKDFVKWYNNKRPHQSLGYLTPDEKAYGFMDKLKHLPTIPQKLQQQII